MLIIHYLLCERQRFTHLNVVWYFVIIIECYFLQNLGITPGMLYNQVLEIHKDSFEVSIENNTNYTNILLAKSMFCYIGTSSSSMNSNLFYSTPTDDLDQNKKFISNLFKAMNQYEHY